MSAESEPKSPRTCPCCGGSQFIAGYVGPMRMTFRRRNLGLFAFGEDIRAEKCADCGNVQFFGPRERGRS